LPIFKSHLSLQPFHRRTFGRFDQLVDIIRGDFDEVS
jgi:hypothetical protein